MSATEKKVATTGHSMKRKSNVHCLPEYYFQMLLCLFVGQSLILITSAEKKAAQSTHTQSRILHLMTSVFPVEIVPVVLDCASMGWVAPAP